MTATAPTLFDEAPPSLRTGVLNSVKGPIGSIGITLAATIIIGLIWAGPSFLAPSNIQIVGVTVAIPLIVAIMASFALLAGVVDLSIGSMVGFAAVIFNQLVFAGLNPWLVAGIAIVVGVVVGLVNALVIVRFGAEPLAVTLGMLTLLRGLCQVIVVNAPPSTLVEPLYNLTQGALLGFPTLLLIGIGITLVAAGFVSKTRSGRKIQAVGETPGPLRVQESRSAGCAWWRSWPAASAPRSEASCTSASSARHPTCSAQGSSSRSMPRS